MIMSKRIAIDEVAVHRTRPLAVYGDPLKNDEQIREKVLPNLKECLDRARKP